MLVPLTGFRRGFSHSLHVVAPDDRRFLMIQGADAPGELVMIQNWLQALKGKLKK